MMNDGLSKKKSPHFWEKYFRSELFDFPKTIAIVKNLKIEPCQAMHTCVITGDLPAAN